MEPMKPMGTWRDSKLVVDGDEFLKTLVSGVFGKTLPEKASNFMRKEAWDKYVGTRLGKGFFRDRWERKGREAVDGKAASAFLGLVRASFAGEVERHPGTDTSRRLTEFLDTACRPRYDDGVSNLPVPRAWISPGTLSGRRSRQKRRLFASSLRPCSNARRRTP